MKRLTEVDGKGNWCIAGVDWGNVKGDIYGALCKLKDYEDTGLSPVEVAELNTFDGSQAVKATAKLQEEQRKHKWVPVSEQLPEDGTYLCTMEEELCGIEEPFTSMCGFYGGKWDEEGCVIAWMPLPEPYGK